jgi:branched-chain amino acid transport system ATP-binding protein
MAILEIEELTTGYGEVQILWGTSMTLDDGNLTSLVGTNGAGKTTLLKAILGLLKPWSGQIKFKGKDITSLPAHAKAELGIVLVPEGRQLFTDMSVDENLEMGASVRRARPSQKQNRELVLEMFPRLAERLTQKAGTLSGGEQQMLAVGRGIMANPAILMMDELSLGLAPVLVYSLFDSLNQLKKAGITLLLVEQNVHLALSVSDYGYVLSQGLIELQGLSEELSKNEHVRKAYLGL